MNSNDSLPEQPQTFTREFTNEGATYVYCREQLTNLQSRLVETVYRTMASRQSKEIGSIAEAFAAGNHNYKIYALSFLLRRKDNYGVLAKFEKPDIMNHEKTAVFAFVENLPFSYDAQIEEVLADFFTSHGMYLLKIGVEMSYIGNAMKASQKMQEFQLALSEGIDKTFGSQSEAA